MAVDLRPPPARTRRASTAPAAQTKATAARTPAQENDAQAAQREEGLLGWVQVGTAVAMLTKQYADAQTVAEHVPKIVHEAVLLAGKYEKMAGAIDKVVAAGPFAGLITAAIPFGLQLAVNHNLIRNPGILAGMGIKPREVLEAEGKEAEMRLVRQAIAAQRKFAEEKAAFEQELAEHTAEANGKGNGLP